MEASTRTNDLVEDTKLEQNKKGTISELQRCKKGRRRLTDYDDNYYEPNAEKQLCLAKSIWMCRLNFGSLNGYFLLLCPKLEKHRHTLREVILKILTYISHIT